MTLDDATRFDELPIPFQFEAESVEGRVNVQITRTPDSHYFERCKPYVYYAGKIELWGDEHGDYTLGQLKADILAFSPKYTPRPRQYHSDSNRDSSGNLRDSSGNS